MAAERTQGHAQGREVGGVERALTATSGDTDDTAEMGGAAQEREEVGDEADARVVCYGGQLVEVFRCFCLVCLSARWLRSLILYISRKSSAEHTHRAAGDLAVAYVPLRSILGVTALKNKTFRLSSFLLISSQTRSTTLIRLTSARMNVYSPPGFRVLHSATMRSPASCDRPRKYARGLTVCFANCLSVASPMPLVAPTKRATRVEGKVEEIRELEVRIVDRGAIVKGGGGGGGGRLMVRDS